MENSCLNQAHSERRKADRLIKQGKLNKAIQCHERAIDFLSTAMKFCDLNVVRESLISQREYHLREIWLLHSRIPLQEYRKRFNTMSNEKSSPTASSQDENGENNSAVQRIQNQIMRTLSEADLALRSHTNSSTFHASLEQVFHCHQHLRDLLDELFQLLQTARTVSGTAELVPNSSSEREKHILVDDSTSQESENETNDQLPVLAPLEIPQFDFTFISDEGFNGN